MHFFSYLVSPLMRLILIFEDSCLLMIELMFRLWWPVLRLTLLGWPLYGISWECITYALGPSSWWETLLLSSSLVD